MASKPDTDKGRTMPSKPAGNIGFKQEYKYTGKLPSPGAAGSGGKPSTPKPY